MRAARYDGEADEWDAHVARCPAGTLQHTRRFLSYHGDRLEDRSVVVRDTRQRLVAAVPAAVSPEDPSSVVSHPGAAYGGVVCEARTQPGDCMAILDAVCGLLREQGASRLVYKTVPPHLHDVVWQTDLYALWRRGARLVQRNLWNVVDLRRPQMAPGRRRAVRKAQGNGVEVAEDNSDSAYAAFFALLSERLGTRHSVKPVHTLDEMRLLRDLFPDRIRLWVARDADGECLSGCWLFTIQPGILHGQYGATSAAGREAAAFDLVVDTVIRRAAADGGRYLSLGRSTEGDGTVLNAGLFSYKAGFGRASIVHDVYEIDLAGGRP